MPKITESEYEVPRITESDLKDWNKITWNGVIGEYWLPVLPPSDKYTAYSHRVAVRFNEWKNQPPESFTVSVFLSGGGAILKHIRTMPQLERLYKSLAGISIQVSCLLAKGIHNE